MSQSPEDWRLHGQERFLQGASLKLVHWSSKDPQWDHDHCEFCTTKFADPAIPAALHEGYATFDLKYWVCSQCFSDFKDRFQWVV